jgi:hypothetical protein
MVSDIEDAPVEDTKDKVWFTEAHLRQFLTRFRESILRDIEENVSASDLVRDEDCDIELCSRELSVEVQSFNMNEIESAVSHSINDFLDSEELFKSEDYFK